jgi:hypothetical protein
MQQKTPVGARKELIHKRNNISNNGVLWQMSTMQGGVVHSRMLKLALIWGAANVARLIGRMLLWLDQA